MKAVLVIDMPKDCRRCQLMVDRFCYGIPADEVHDSININERPKWCPLKPLPQKIDKGMEVDISGGDDYETGYIHGWHRGVDKGWNDCIKAITGETE